MANFKRFDVWKAAHAAPVQIYRETAAFPQHEQFGLTNQLRRAAVSVAASVAHGAGRGGNREFARFLTIAIGSSSEVESLLIQADDLGYLRSRQLIEAFVLVARKLHRLRRAVPQSIPV